MNSLLDQTPLGAGLSFRSEYRADLLLNQSSVDCLEIIADHYMDAPPEKMAELDLLKTQFTLIPHSLDLSIGSADGVRPDYLEKLALLIERIRPPWWSDHLALTRAAGLHLGHLSPVPFNEDSLRIVLSNLKEVRRLIPAPMLLENITWSVHLPDSLMEEGPFIRKVLEESGTGLLLDVTNLHTNAVNHRESVRRFLDSIPLERVVQLHVAGGHHGERGQLVDSHSRPVTEEVWQLCEQVLQEIPARAVILERDENLPVYAELVAEVDRARRIGRKFRRWT